MTPAIATMAEMFEKAQRELATERDALRATNRQLAEANATLTAELAELRALNAQLAAQVDDARRQRDECADALSIKAAAAVAIEALVVRLDARLKEAVAVLRKWHAWQSTIQDVVPDDLWSLSCAVIENGPTSEPTSLEAAVTAHTEHVAVSVIVERVTDMGGLLVIRCDGQVFGVTTDEAAALVTALLADGAVHNAWLHGRGGQ